MYVCMCICKLQVSEVSTSCTIYLMSVALIPLSQVNIKEWETNFSGKLYSICLTSCKAWRYRPTYVAGNLGKTPVNFTFMVSPPMIDTKKHVYSNFWMSETPSHHTHAISSCMHFCYVNNGISFSIEYKNWHIFLEKGDVWVNRVYKLLEIIRNSTVLVFHQEVFMNIMWQAPGYYHHWQQEVWLLN